MVCNIYFIYVCFLPLSKALTGEPIFHDDNLWQQAREDNRAKMSHYTSLLDNMIATLQDTSTQLQVKISFSIIYSFGCVKGTRTLYKDLKSTRTTNMIIILAIDNCCIILS